MEEFRSKFTWYKSSLLEAVSKGWRLENLVTGLCGTSVTLEEALFNCLDADLREEWVSEAQEEFLEPTKEELEEMGYNYIIVELNRSFQEFV